ncbi:Crp/Fnr family transcriptional regulator [Actinomadura latina]|uniref:Crp/Fnr family transcriptional regulator n=1 Tax=Actinomadura latina TaxID=163603 RepID=A0A846Z6I2_9ACTN|nr:Crp/Fnr family transcriptional regulator [Actinomadura latina]NKZ06852.1 Crp/Fnr family transcriptional regulator [Actinomadura latina]
MHRRTTPLRRPCAKPHHCPRRMRLKVLSQARFFTGLDIGEITAIEARMRVRGYAEGERIYPAGARADHLFVLASGRVKLVRPTPDGQDVLVGIVTPGGLFGTLTTLGEPEFTDSAETLTVSCALSISADDFRAVLRRHPSVALAVVDDLAHRLEEAHQAVRRLSGGTVEQRVAATLLTLAGRLGEPRGGAVLLQLPLTRSDLAAMTGSTTESVSRAMSRLRKEGVIETGRRWTSIVDRDRLVRLADADARTPEAGN